MEFVRASDFKSQSGQVWEKLAEHNRLVLTRHGKPFAILSEISSADLEAGLQVDSRRYLGRTIDALRDSAHENGLDNRTLDEINTEIQAARNELQAKKDPGGKK